LTKGGKNLSLFLCIDYGGRDEIVRAVQAGARSEQEITDYLTAAAPEPDLILRTGGQKRLSNFLLWQSAYSELMFLDCLFPELDTLMLGDALNDF
jgi:undecaprenyl diphosphate synthase